jgi:RND family efflux transporter MFP subunit
MKSAKGLWAPLIAATLLAGCGAKPDNRSGNTAGLSPVPVHVRTIEERTRPLTEEVMGTLRAKSRATLEPKVSGRIVEMPVVLGEKVRQGQVLARLDAGEIVARVEQAEAALEQADRDGARIAALFEQQNVTRAEYDSAQARQRVARAMVAEAKAMMSYAEIVAPFDGMVTKKWVEVGDLATPGKPLLDLVDPSLLQLEADVPEAIASRIELQKRLAVRVDAADRDVEGVVTEFAPVADPASRTFRVKLDLPAATGLMPGQFARLSVPIGERQSVRVPTTAVVRRGQLEMVFSVTNQQAQLHLVKTGKIVGDEIEILSGLSAGYVVVASGADQLTDGQPVEAK